MKQQDPMISSSSSRRESSPLPENLRAKKIGCMSGLLRLVCKYNSPRRFLTFGKKQEKNEMPSPNQTCLHSFSQEQNKIIQRIISYDAPRSPTLPAEIRRSNSINSRSDQSFQTPSTVVARLMGLNDTPVAATTASELTLVAEKRRRLLGALEKCDEDLKALKKIIEMVKSSVSDDDKGNSNDDDVYEFNRRKWLLGEKGELQPRPAYVLDEFTRSASSGYFKRYINGIRVPQRQTKKPGEEDLINVNFIDRITNEIIEGKTENVSSPLRTSKAMIDSVSEVCRDISWGERREIGRIGLALQDNICRDLIEEIVRELGFACNIYPLPFESCKKRLSF